MSDDSASDDSASDDSASDDSASEDTARIQLTAQWDVRGIDLTRAVVGHRGTLRAAAPTLPAHALETLPQLSVGGRAEDSADLVLGKKIGEGGMGIVHHAEQRPLRRDVAVKRAHDHASDDDLRQLVHEARITGALEHPNVIPIHALGRDEANRPVIVMKYVDGTNWERMLLDHHREGQGALLASLEHHLRILVDVSKAVEFAHARGVVHRDIKPANVMFGSFGEVYLLDWGIAVATRPVERLGLPLAADIRDVTGSPAYMAPEMACGDGSKVDPRTDVYLLGANLHEILVGKPPHSDKTAYGMLTKAFRSRPHVYGVEVPSALVKICHRAMHRRRSQRYQTAAAFANDIELFLERQGSHMLSEAAAVLLEKLRETVAVAGKLDDTGSRTIYKLFHECRYGFSSALRIWEGNAVAKSQLQQAVELMIGLELSRGAADAASSLLSELPTPNPKLAKRIGRKRRQQTGTQKELLSLKRNLDPTQADRQRSKLSFVGGATWIAAHALLGWAHGSMLIDVGPPELAALYMLYVLGTLGGGLAARDTLLEHATAGLKLQMAAATTYMSFTVFWLVGWAIDLGLEDGISIMSVYAAAMWILAAIIVDERLLCRAFPMLATLLMVLFFPVGSLWWLGAGGAIGSIILGVLQARTQHRSGALPLSERLLSERLLSKRWSKRLASVRKSNQHGVQLGSESLVETERMAKDPSKDP